MSGKDVTIDRDKPWVKYGTSVENEDFLIGNRAGLELLKQKLDHALTSGECRIEEAGVEFVGIRLLPVNPNENRAVKPVGLKNAIALVACALFIFSFILIFGIGLIQLWSWLK